MTQTRIPRREAPVVQLMMGLKQSASPTKQAQHSRATVDDFEREHMGIAAKE
jgi:hypothetical protein